VHDLAVFSARREKRRFDVRSFVVRRIIEQYIIRDAVPAELAVFDHRFNAFRPEFVAK